MGAVVVTFAAAVAYAISRDATRSNVSQPAPAAAAPSVQTQTPAPLQAAATQDPHAGHAHAAAQKAPAAQPARAARTAEEEAYIRALWPIHGEVERSAMRMSLGQIFYATQDLPRAELKTRVEEALAAFAGAEKNLAALAPPASLKPDHDTYLAGVRQFRESATEIRKMFADGKDEHMRTAYPASQEASDKIRDVGGKLWPHEFPPH